MAFFKKKSRVPSRPGFHPDTGEPINVIEELKKCKESPAYFAYTWAYTKSSKKGICRFRLYDFQQDTITAWTQHRYNIILKSRQMGISWLAAAYIVWFIIFGIDKPKDVLCMAHKQAAATKMLDKVKFIMLRLPGWMQDALKIRKDQWTVDNRESIQLANGSKVEASSTTENAAVGDTLSLLVVDEAALIPHAEDTWTSLEPTLEIGGDCLVISTPRGVGNWFHTTFVDAESETNDFNPIVLGWELHPDRLVTRCKKCNKECTKGVGISSCCGHFTYEDESWARIKIRKIGERRFAREYACRFDKSGDTLIVAERLELIEQHWMDVLVPKKAARHSPEEGLWIFKDAVPGHRYIVAADTASGDTATGEKDEDDLDDDTVPAIGGSDFSACVVIDIDTCEAVATYYGKLLPGKFALILYNLCNTYYQALFVYDATGGWSGPIYGKFLELGYRRMYRQPKINQGGIFIKAKINLLDDKNKAGFTITNSNRGTIVSAFRELLETTSIGEEGDTPVFYDRRILNELKTFIRNKRDRYEHAPGHHDDLVFACLIGFYVREQWLFYHGNQGSIANQTLHSLRTSRQLRATLPNQQSPNYRSIKLNNKKKQTLQKYANSYIDPNSGIDLAAFFNWKDDARPDDESVENQETDPNYLQRGIFDGNPR